MKFSTGSAWENKDGRTAMDKKRLEKYADAIVVGAGHAGCEAALACARLGLETYLFTVSVESIALMPCNPSIGGSSKGHLVREVDALGGEMGKAIDRTFIQSRMLNRSKGPAVHSLRAQADKAAYSTYMRGVLQNTPHIHIRQMEITQLLTEEISETADGGPEAAGAAKKDPEKAGNKRICGVVTRSGAIYHCKVCILCTGTYLRARCIYGEVSMYTGPNGLQAANGLTDSLKELGIRMYRFKTGTPCRIDGRTIDYTKLERQDGDVPVIPFSFETNPADVQIDQVPCYLAYTNETTHQIIRENIDRSPLYSGVIEGTGPRYCPSIEDKVMRFPDRIRHQIFIEPEGKTTNEMYLSGMSSSLPEDVQDAMYHSMVGFENADIVKNAYAIEYDCIDATQLKHSLEFKEISGLFACGQFNGSSGYEEAAAQGIIAGINAAMYVNSKEPLIIDRSEGYIGVLIDDLVTKENHEPYRMMTSRSEYRLLLRQDNADIRLTEKGYKAGLISESRYLKFCEKKRLIDEETQRVAGVRINGTKEVNEYLEQKGSTPLLSSVSLAELIRRPELNYQILKEIDPERPELSPEIQEQVNIRIRYEGYIRRQQSQVEKFKKMESRKIPEDIDYQKVLSLRTEARQKLEKIRPVSIGQASRIAGVSPADISVLLIYLQTVGAKENRRQPE